MHTKSLEGQISELLTQLQTIAENTTNCDMTLNQRDYLSNNPEIMVFSARKDS